jgi:predicted nucleotidyltransferase
VHEVLGVNAIAAYLFGSAVLGGLCPESDLDVADDRQDNERFARRMLVIFDRRTGRGR